MLNIHTNSNKRCTKFRRSGNEFSWQHGTRIIKFGGKKKKQTKYEYTNKNTVRKHKGMDYVQVPD